MIEESIERWRTKWSPKLFRLEGLGWHPITLLATIGVCVAVILLVGVETRKEVRVSTSGELLFVAAPVAMVLLFATLATLRFVARIRVRRELAALGPVEPAKLGLALHRTSATHELLRLAVDPAARSSPDARIDVTNGFASPPCCFSCLDDRSLLPWVVMRETGGMQRLDLLVCRTCRHHLTAVEIARNVRMANFPLHAFVVLWFLIPLWQVERVWVHGGSIAGSTFSLVFMVIGLVTLAMSSTMLRVEDTAPTFGVYRPSLQLDKNGRYWLYVEREFAERAAAET